MEKAPVGRFAPTPSGRMHLGNVFAALIAWLAVRSQDGSLVLRMEDLDTQRTSEEYAAILREDLCWLGLDWDWEMEPQSRRTNAYQLCFEQLADRGLLYPCYCTRSQLHSVNAPHSSDGTYVYPGTCRNLTRRQQDAYDRPPAWRLRVPDEIWSFRDRNFGDYAENLALDCGDFVVRRGDGVFVYQLAVVVDDAFAGVTQVVRGSDLLSSVPRQMYLQQLLGYPHPEYGHVPLLLSADGRRLSKRDRDLDLGQLRKVLRPEQLIGYLAHAAGLLDRPVPVSAKELTGEFSWEKLGSNPVYVDVNTLRKMG